MALTESIIRALGATGKVYREPDGGGLFLEVSPKGARRFRLKYRINGRQRMLALGDFPDTSLRAARALRETAKAALAQGDDPAIVLRSHTGTTASETTGLPRNTWGSYMRDYLAKREREGAAPATMAKLRNHAREVEAVIGGKPLAEVRAPDIIECCRVYEARGMTNSAHAVRTLCSLVFRYAIATGVETYDYASVVQDALLKDRPQNHAAVTDPAEVGRLMRAIRKTGLRSPQVRAGLLLSAYCVPRNRQLREMRWSDIDGDVWHCPAHHMKGERGLQRDHLVPLPRQAREVLEWIEPITGKEERVLHSFESRSGMISENSFNRALDLVGFDKTRHRHHGFRTMFSTTMNEQGWNSDWIEMQLAHVPQEKVRGVYNKARYLPQRAEMMQAYADWLDRMADHQ